MFTNAKTPQHCILMTSHLRNRIIADGAHFELRLHLIYLTNDVLHHWWAIESKSWITSTKLRQCNIQPNVWMTGLRHLLIGWNKTTFRAQTNCVRSVNNYVGVLIFKHLIFLCLIIDVSGVCHASSSQRKQQKDLLAALQKVVVPIYCTSFLAVEEDKQQRITRVRIHTY